MNLNDFADFKISVDDTGGMYLRHANCEDRYVEEIELNRPLNETNVKWLMLHAMVHHQEVHQNEPGTTE